MAGAKHYAFFRTLQSHFHIFSCIVNGLLLEGILHNQVRHFVTHKQVQGDKRRPI